MTASTTRCFASRPERLLRWLLCALTALLAFAVQAEEGVIRSAEIVPGDGGYVLNADIEIELEPDGCRTEDYAESVQLKRRIDAGVAVRAASGLLPLEVMQSISATAHKDLGMKKGPELAFRPFPF